MTLKELAKLANVSVSTVSRVINGKDTHSASPKTREKIWRLVRETNYIPNVAAQNLRKGAKNIKQKTYSIACVFTRTSDGLADPFFSQIFQAIEQEAIKNSCTVTGVFSAQSMSKDGIYDDLILSDPNGIILIGRYTKPLYTYL
ncbi:MAG: LacI family transcriptional regulator, partial [Clostridiaceae bacterium]|nr:LacI family transcriptional regulator [Clostridiaceae bacterium]